MACGGTPENPNFRMGTNVLVPNWAYAAPPSGGSIGFIWSPTRAYWFPATGGPAMYGAHYTMAINMLSGNYVLNDLDTGTVYTFDATSRLLYTTTTAGGQTTTNTIGAVTGGYQISQTTRSFGYTECDNSLTTTENLLYTYFPIDGSPTSGLLQYATLTRSDATTVQIRRLAMTYYGDGDAGGMPGDLMTVALQTLDGSEWATISTEYCRYYVENYDAQPGYPHGLKFVVGPEAFVRLSREANPLLAPDSVVANYADYYFEYTYLVGGNNSRRVTKSVTDGGTLPHVFTYESSSFADGPNNWSLKSVATHADNSQKTTYTNYLAQPMLTDLLANYSNPAAGRWINYIVYDASAIRPASTYSPMAINMGASPPYNESSAGLAVSPNSGGKVNVNTYLTGGVLPAGFYYLGTSSVKNGAAGAATPINSLTYMLQTTSSAGVVLPASSTNYPDGATAVTTDFDYTFFSGTLQVQTKSTLPPPVPSTQNGDDIQYQMDTVFDIQGRLSQQFDPYNSSSPPTYKPSTQFVYDEPTGAMVQSIRNPYSGTPPDTVQYNLVTDFKVDALGRSVRTLRPTFNSNGQQVRAVSWTVYRDVQHEIWTAAGYAAGSVEGEYQYTLMNPVSITKMDADGRTTDAIQAVRLRAGLQREFSLVGGAAGQGRETWPESQGASHPLTPSRGLPTSVGRGPATMTRARWFPAVGITRSLSLAPASRTGTTTRPVSATT